jgi:hypothetical protein
MGNQLLKKSMGIILLTVSMLHAKELTIDDINKLVNDIKQERIGLMPEEIKQAKDPFKYFKTIKRGPHRVVKKHSKPQSTHHRHYHLMAILNDRAKINHKWYRLHSRVDGGYIVSKIGKNYVELSQKNRHIRLFLKQRKNKNIKLLVK